MPDKISGVGQGYGTGLPNDFDYSDVELRALEFLRGENSPQPEPESEPPLEPSRIFTKGEWEGWQSLPASYERETMKTDTFRRLYSGRLPRVGDRITVNISTLQDDPK